MRRLTRRTFCAGPLLALASSPAQARRAVRHFVFFGQDREELPKDRAFAGAKALVGAQIAYSWRQLEPEPDRYEFDAVREDLAVLTARGKRLWVQLQDVTFSPQRVNVPRYLREDPRYHGGAAPQYEIPNDQEAEARPAGWVARRWDPAVQERLHRLFAALGKAFDGRIEGINLAETAVEFGESGKLYPPGFTPAGYRDAIITNLRALKRAFPRSVALQYANFMPGEWRPTDDKGYLRAVCRAAREANVGLGGPDLLPYRPGQVNGPYPLFPEAAGQVPIGIAVQEGNYADKDPKTGKRASVPELLRFATESLRADYLFWCREEPYYTAEVIPRLGKDEG